MSGCIYFSQETFAALAAMHAGGRESRVATDNPELFHKPSYPPLNPKPFRVLGFRNLWLRQTTEVEQWNSGLWGEIKGYPAANECSLQLACTSPHAVLLSRLGLRGSLSQERH